MPSVQRVGVEVTVGLVLGDMAVPSIASFAALAIRNFNTFFAGI